MDLRMSVIPLGGSESPFDRVARWISSLQPLNPPGLFNIADTEDVDVSVEDQTTHRVPRFPSPHDEPTKVLKLSGENEAEYVEVDGWTHTIPHGFPGLRKDLRMKVPEFPDPNSALNYLKDAEDDRETLQRLATSSHSAFYNPVRSPLVLQVVAKKAPVVFFKKDTPAQVNVISNAILADHTGACLVTCFNEANFVFLDHVDVGDYLVIHKSRSMAFDISQFKVPLPLETDLLAVWLKIDVRGITRIPNGSLNCRATRKLPNLLFKHNAITLRPSQFIRTDGRLSLPEEPTPSQDSQSSSNRFFNLIGVVNYSGRMERQERFESHGKCLVRSIQDYSVDEESGRLSGTSELQSITQYYAYQWLQIVDDESQQPLLLKVFFNGNTSGAQDKLVPGALAIITHCQIPVSCVTGSVQSSDFSQIYVNAEYERYFRVMPVKQLMNCAHLLRLDTFKKIYKRNDLTWSVGGTCPVAITDKQSFCDVYTKLKQKETDKKKADEEKVADKSWSHWKLEIPANHVFARRENLTLVVRAKIDPVMISTKEPSQLQLLPIKCALHYTGIHYKELLDTGNRYPFHKKISNYENCRCNKCETLHWHSSRRNVGPPQIPAVETLSAINLLEDVCNKNKDSCGPFLFPSKYKPMPANALPAVARMPKLGEQPFLRVNLVDLDHPVVYKAVWKGLPFNEMKTKLLQTGRKQEILALVEIFCCESQDVDGLEVLLKDFVFLDTDGSDTSTSANSSDIEMITSDSDTNVDDEDEEMNVQ